MWQLKPEEVWEKGMCQPLFHNPWVHKSPVTKKSEQQAVPHPCEGGIFLENMCLMPQWAQCWRWRTSSQGRPRGLWSSWDCAHAREKFSDFFAFKTLAKHVATQPLRDDCYSWAICGTPDPAIPFAMPSCVQLFVYIQARCCSTWAASATFLTYQHITRESRIWCLRLHAAIEL